ncbi:putative aspartate aminotransferase [Melanomma pulvis-pyrius CBS 109.77]|uniref:Putative aspartate aminotransferase n=1 Tax=Melanomma pulvis-pyrius CBS 109.77 TaxID=1314802 RepID=A0A6A6X6Z3_9PLEO|nr:putative aspartate aminotransferase [Melanomma pulvis-pyrius CBS 109.77]
MSPIPVFDVERWMDEYEKTLGVLNIAETCVASVSVHDLVSFCEDKTLSSPVDFPKKLTYGPIPGSQRLRERIAAVYNNNSTLATLGADDVLVTQGTIGANFLLLYTLVNPGDHIVCMYPTYQQLYDVTRSLGAEVSLWRLREDNAWVPDLKELEGLVKPNTKIRIFYAASCDIIVFCDEVYRPLFHDLFEPGSAIPPSIATMDYDNTIATGSMSKAFALAGIRVGWIASRNKKIIQTIASIRDYTTISVSQVDDQIASYALSKTVVEPLLRRNIKLANTNIALLEAFIENHKEVCSWVKPKAGTTAFVRIAIRGKPVDEVSFCQDVIAQTKVFFVPGSKCFGHGQDFAGYVRFGYVSDTDVLKRGLDALGVYIQKHLV